MAHYRPARPTSPERSTDRPALFALPPRERGPVAIVVVPAEGKLVLLFFVAMIGRSAVAGLAGSFATDFLVHWRMLRRGMTIRSPQTTCPRRSKRATNLGEFPPAIRNH
ncbi:MAG TPA: hypothetical protein VFS57_06715 [Gemmatimonadaceae bacterium]|nr:hypothetical protein [Gemmatimonadaceae bacterium]